MVYVQSKSGLSFKPGDKLLNRCVSRALLGIGLTSFLFCGVAYGSNAEDRVDCVYHGKVAVNSSTQCRDQGGAYIKTEFSTIPLVTNVLQKNLLTSPVEQYLIAELYRQSIKNPGDQEQALRWYELSAKQNYFPALASLGEIYEEGSLVDKDLVISNRYFRQAYRNNDLTRSYMSAITSLDGEQTTASDAVTRLGQATDKHRQLKEALNARLAIKKNWQRELQSFNEGFAPAEFLRGQFLERTTELKSLSGENKVAIDALQRKREDISLLLNELEHPEQVFSAAGVEVIEQDT